MRRAVLIPLATLVALVLISALGGTAFAQASPGQSTIGADAEVARLRQQADAMSEQYFDALAELTDVQQRVDEIEARIPALSARADDLRAITQRRAVAAYIRAGQALSPVIGADDPIHAARRVLMLDRLNARDDAIAAELRTAVNRLSTDRAALRAARERAVAALDDVRARGRQVDALLVDAEAQRSAAVTAASAASSASADSTAATTSEQTPAAGPGGSVPAPGSGTATAPATTTTTAPRPATPPPPPYTPTNGVHPSHDEPFLVCTRTREASGNYGAYNGAGPYMGAYQFLQSTWNGAANHAGRPDLIGVPPHIASQYDQDDVAWALYQWQGSRPWGGRCD